MCQLAMHVLVGLEQTPLNLLPEFCEKTNECNNRIILICLTGGEFHKLLIVVVNSVGIRGESTSKMFPIRILQRTVMVDGGSCLGLVNTNDCFAASLIPNAAQL